MERNLLLTIQYDGTDFCGWQRQPQRPTVQGTLEAALSQVCGKLISVNGAGRTDAGVHAYGQRASFKGDFGIPTERLALAVNNRLAGGMRDRIGPGAVRVTAVQEMPPGFHARFDAVGKTYLYRIRCGQPLDIFQRNYCHYLAEPLDLAAMRQAAEQIKGTHDFQCFQAAGGQERETTVRTVYDLDIRLTPPESPELPAQKTAGMDGCGDLAIRVTGDGFLYNMVRIIVGTLVEAGLHRRRPQSIAQVIAGCRRQDAGYTAPPQGLYLEKVYYQAQEVPGYDQGETQLG